MLNSTHSLTLYWSRVSAAVGHVMLQVHKAVQEDQLESSQELVSTDPERFAVPSQSDSSGDPP